jgi:hypothetical protein
MSVQTGDLTGSLQRACCDGLAVTTIGRQHKPFLVFNNQARLFHQASDSITTYFKTFFA